MSKPLIQSSKPRVTNMEAIHQGDATIRHPLRTLGLITLLMFASPKPANIATSAVRAGHLASQSPASFPTVSLVEASFHMLPKIAATTPISDVQKTYVIRVVAADSKTSVVHAKVQVQIPGASSKHGLTDEAGIFWFTWDSPAKPVRVHISVQAQGFLPVDDFRKLAKDTLIPLSRL